MVVVGPASRAARSLPAASDTDEALGLIAALYDAALHPERWPAALEDVGAALRGRELELLPLLRPHLQRCRQIRARIAALEAQQKAAEEAFDRLPFGIVFVDARGRALRLNRAAEAIVAAADGLTVRSRALTAATARETVALQRLIGEAAAPAASRRVSGGAMALTRPSMLRPLSVLIAPLPPDADDRSDGRTAAVIFVSDPERAPEVPESVLARLFDLTRAQASLAALLAQGLDLVEAADRLGVTISTARTHLRQVFGKTGTDRQAELVRLILRSTAGLGS